MAISQTGNRTHDAVVTAAESSRQVAVSAAGNSQAAARAADIAFYRVALASAKQNGLPTGAFIEALMELGTGGS